MFLKLISNFQFYINLTQVAAVKLTLNNDVYDVCIEYLVDAGRVSYTYTYCKINYKK